MVFKTQNNRYTACFDILIQIHDWAMIMRNLIKLLCLLIAITGTLLMSNAQAATLSCTMEGKSLSGLPAIGHDLCDKASKALGLVASKTDKSDYRLVVNFQNMYVADYSLLRLNDGEQIASGQIDVADASIETALLSHLPLILSRSVSSL